MTVELRAADLDLSGLVHAGDHVWWGQGTSEPLTLSEALVAQRARVGPLHLFLGVSFSGTVRPEHADRLSFRSYGALGTNQRLSRAGVLDVLPCHYSQIPLLLETGALRCDVAFLQVSGPNARGEYSLGVADDYMLEAARKARTVVVEVNEQAPWTHCRDRLSDLRIDYLVRSSRPMLEVQAQEIGDVERRISQHAVRFVPDGGVLQMGIGAIPDAILSALHGHRDLGVHSGMISDGIVDLAEAGVLTNARKTIDTGRTVTGVLFGSQRLYAFARENPDVVLCPVTYTHSAAVIARLEQFVALNSALEVDLTGQVNAEVGDDVYLGAVGGQVDFVRAASLSPHGRSLIALPSASRSLDRSRIVAKISSGVTTTPRSDLDLVVTEWGAAELRGQTLAERARRLISIAHPAFREALERSAHALLRRGASAS